MFIPRKEVIKSGTVWDLDVINQITYQGVPFIPGGNATDEKIKITAADTTAGYLGAKVAAGTGIQLTTTNPGANETLTIACTVVDLDVKVKVSANDTTAGFLNGKLVAGTGITFTENNDGGNETLTVAIGNHDASLITTGTVATARLGSGTANSTTYLRGDQTWQTIASGVTGFTPSQNTAAPNATVNASRLLVNVATTNGDIVLQPKGTGAVLAQLPDSTATGGDKRGANAVDLQTARPASTRVASGSFSVVCGGEGNIANNTHAVAVGGQTSQATGAGSFVGSGFSNSAAGYASVSVGGGSNNVNAQYSVSSGGQFHTINGAFSGVASGYFNQVQADYSAILSGNANQVVLGGAYNAIINGTNNYSGGSYTTIVGRDCRHEGFGSDALVVGRYAVSTNWSAPHQVYSASRFSSSGDCQRMEFMLSRVTTDATATQLTLDGATPYTAGAGNATNRVYLTYGFSSSVHVFDGIVMAKLVNGTATKAWRITGGIRWHGSTLTMISSTTTELFSTGSAWTIAAAADGTNQALLINVTGGASETIRWNAHLQILKVAG
jgi:hypothetical protein